MKRIIARELMDDPVDSLVELEVNLADIEFANRSLGGIAPVRREIRRSNARSLLDVCCGSADIVRALVRDARGRGAELAVTALDSSEQMLAIASRRTPADLGIRFVVADAMALPFPERAFDAVTCNLALHHFEPDAARALLGEMRRVARSLVLVCDLRRSRTAFGAALLWSRVWSRNRLTRHDAPLSVRRAYTPGEAVALAAQAGWHAPRVRGERFFRMTLVDRGVHAPVDAARA